MEQEFEQVSKNDERLKRASTEYHKYHADKDVKIEKVLHSFDSGRVAYAEVLVRFTDSTGHRMSGIDEWTLGLEGEKDDYVELSFASRNCEAKLLEEYNEITNGREDY